MNYNLSRWLLQMFVGILNSIGLYTKKQYTNLYSLVDDQCQVEDEIKETARPILGDYLVDGDSYGVPSSLDIVEELIKKIPKNTP